MVGVGSGIGVLDIGVEDSSFRAEICAEIYKNAGTPAGLMYVDNPPPKLQKY